MIITSVIHRPKVFKGDLKSWNVGIQKAKEGDQKKMLGTCLVLGEL